MDKKRIEKAVREILLAIGEDPDREGLLDTPSRVARMYEEIFAGIATTPKEVAKLFSAENYDGIVTLRDIPFYSMCEHHLLPFFGRASVAYIPGDNKVLGLSKIARIVDIIAKKPQLQERLSNEIAMAIESATNSQGVVVRVEAEHLCMTMRGINKPGAVTITHSARGLLKSNKELKLEALSMLGDKSE